MPGAAQIRVASDGNGRAWTGLTCVCAVARARFVWAQSKMNKTTVCAKDPARSFKRVAKCIKSQVSRTRPDLVKPALARWTKYHRALKRIASKKVAK